ncbi:RibD family protein [Bacteroidales bacterium OttesenSCG-928-I14]|nr:RibD family protein [Bacteroidales bacterium OttesenSCG-928-I14]
MKPYVILTMLTSIDGKIEGDFIHNHNEELGDFFEYMKLEISDAWGNGSNTHEKYFSDESVNLLSFKDKEPNYEDNIIKGKNPYIVSFDSTGKVKWNTNTLIFPDDIQNSVLVVTTKQVKPEYLAYLNKLGIAYIFAGEKDIDLPMALNKLYTLFGIKRFAIVGGATINANFIKQDLVDEIKIVIAPFIDGSKELTISETYDNSRLTKQFTLKDVEKLEHDGVMLTYIKS